MIVEFELWLDEISSNIVLPLFFIEHLSNTNDSYDSIKPIIMGKIAIST